MTLTRADIETLLRLRYEYTKEKWGDATLDAWWELLGDLEPTQVRRRLMELVRSGATHIPPGLLAQGLAATVASQRDHRPDGDCPHEGAGIGTRCPSCRRELLPWSDPRAQAAFRRGYFEATGREWQGNDDPTGAK